MDICAGRAHVLVEVAPCLSRISRHAFQWRKRDSQRPISNGTEMALPNYRQMFVPHIPYGTVLRRLTSIRRTKSRSAALAHCILHSHRRFLPRTRTMVSDYQASRRGRSSPTRIDTCLTSPWCLDPLLGPLLHHNLISSSFSAGSAFHSAGQTERRPSPLVQIFDSEGKRRDLRREEKVDGLDLEQEQRVAPTDGRGRKTDAA